MTVGSTVTSSSKLPIEESSKVSLRQKERKGERAYAGEVFEEEEEDSGLITRALSGRWNCTLWTDPCIIEEGERGKLMKITLGWHITGHTSHITQYIR